jgi:hypothetical protein
MDFNRKTRLLTALLNRSDAPKRNTAIAALKVIQNESLRNTFAHSFIMGDEKEVTFVERSRHGSYNPTRHTFTLDSFHDHVVKFYTASLSLNEAIDLTPEKLNEFANAAFNVKNKSTTSPVPPNESA